MPQWSNFRVVAIEDWKPCGFATFICRNRKGRMGVLRFGDDGLPFIDLPCGELELKNAGFCFLDRSFQAKPEYSVLTIHNSFVEMLVSVGGKVPASAKELSERSVFLYEHKSLILEIRQQMADLLLKAAAEKINEVKCGEAKDILNHYARFVCDDKTERRVSLNALFCAVQEKWLEITLEGAIAETGLDAAAIRARGQEFLAKYKV